MIMVRGLARAIEAGDGKHGATVDNLFPVQHGEACGPDLDDWHAVDGCNGRAA